MTVMEAIEIVGRTISQMQQQRNNQVVSFIVGVGNHSMNGEAVLKSRVFDYIRSNYHQDNILVWVPDTNKGVIRVRLKLH
jgi:hypothetical protein